MSRVCPQLYEQGRMRTTSCTRCYTGWSRAERRCTIETGAEQFPLAQEVPEYPLQAVCQHQHQALPGPCVVRARGMLCESALVASGMSPDEAMEDPRSFNADFMMTAKEWAATGQ